MSISASRAVSMMIGTRDLARSSRHTSMPDMRGSITSSSTRAGRQVSNWLDGLDAVGGHLHEEPLAPERYGQRIAVALLVVDDENRGRVSHRLQTSGSVGRCGWRQPAAA